jgi:16S rRNA (uracil1498-N3)-methyltransferase
MAQHRFYAAPSAWAGGEITLAAEEAHHARDVLRLAPGAAAQIFDGQGRRAACEFTSRQKSGAKAAILSVEAAPEPATQLCLAQAIPKGKTMEWIIEKAVELGAAGVLPIVTDRTVVRLDAAEALQKQQKWQRVAIEACKQCGQDWLPKIAVPVSLSECLRGMDQDQTAIVAALTPEARPIAELTKNWLSKPARCVLFVGPEGDFSPKEMEMLQQHGAAAVTLGKIILRAETAAIYCLSVFQHELVR